MLPLLAAALLAPSPANDICLAMVPPRLTEQLVRDHADFQLPLLTDAQPDQLVARAIAGTWPCPFVSAADFDGDGRLDRALFLKHKSDPTVRLLAVLNSEGGWRIAIQQDWPLALTQVAIEPLAAGYYEQTKAGPEAARQLDTLKSIEADNAGFLAGNDAGAQRAYFFVNGEWQWIWLRD